MPGDKKIAQSQPSAAGLNSEAAANLAGQNVAPRHPSNTARPYSVTALSSVKGGIDNKAVAEQSVRYPPTSCYDYHYPGYNGAYSQVDGSGHSSSGGGSYTDNGSLLYFMPSYNPYATGTFMGIDGQQAYFSSSEGMPCYSWNSTYTGDAKSATGSNGSMMSNGYNSKRSTNALSGKSSSYPFDMDFRPSSSNVSKSILQSSHRSPLNMSGGLSKGYQLSADFSSLAYQNQGLFSNYFVNARVWNDNERYKAREKSYVNGESEELTRGPRVISLHNEDEKSGHAFKKDQYNLEEFQTMFDHAKFYIIKSYSEDDVHKCIKYDVWSSTPNGNKKLDTAFHDAEVKTRETGSNCPVFLFFSVNGSGQFVGVAEMIGPVDFEKNMDFWQLDKWSGFFNVKWHIIKDIPNPQLRHIILENNDNRPVTYTRDTQEVGLKQGLEMLDIFKNYSAKTSLLDDLNFYENREKLLKAKRISKAAFQPEKNQTSGERIIGEGSMSTNGAASLINLTRNLSLGSNTSKANVGDTPPA